MTSRLSWTFVVAGLALFLYQVGDLIANHSTWSEVFSPAGAGDIIQTLGGALLAMFGAAGLNLRGVTSAPAPSSDQVSDTTRRTLPPAAAVLIAVLAFTSAGCAGLHGAPVNPNPTPTQQQQARQDAIRIEQAIEGSVGIAKFALTTADSLEKQGVITAANLSALATATLTFTNGADQALVALGNAAKDASLLNTAKVLLGVLNPLLAQLENSSNPTLRAIGASLRLASAFVPQYVTASGGSLAYVPESHPRVD